MSKLKNRGNSTSSHTELKKAYMPIYPSMFLTPQKGNGSTALRTRSIPVSSPRPVKLKEFKLQTNFAVKAHNLDGWKTSKGVSKKANVFLILGDYPDLRQALIERGWVENTDQNSLFFNLVWARSAKVPPKLQEDQIINHFPRNFELSCKWNFCENIKKVKKLYDVDHNTFFPRCYRMIGKDYEEFCDMFKTYKALSILKSYSSLKGGCYEKVITSLNVVKRWMHFIEKDIKVDYDRSLNLIHSNEWKILNSNNAHEVVNEFHKYNTGKILTQPGSLSQIVDETIEKLSDLDPQMDICGNKNVWIVKPGGKSRGRDIMVFSNIEEIKSYTQNSQKWVVQKYIENPLLIQNKKFDIRQWVLVTNSEPVTIWIYSSSYLRFSVENYDVGNLSNKFSHLTNNSISKYSKKFGASENGCMWHTSQLIDYIRERYNKDYWRESILPKIKDIVKWSVLSAGYLGRKNCIELFGYDFMIDNSLKPWLIEINSSPALDYSTVISI